MKSLLYVATLSLSLIAVNVVSGMYAAEAAPPIPDNSVTSPKIKDGEVKTPDIATAAVSKDNLKPDAVKLVVVHRFGPLVTIRNLDATGLFAACNSGEIVTGGGFLTDIPEISDKEPIVIDNTRATNPTTNEWFVFLKAAPGDQFLARATVECAHLELGPIT
jgi:hypothetical protein